MLGDDEHEMSEPEFDGEQEGQSATGPLIETSGTSGGGGGNKAVPCEEAIFKPLRKKKMKIRYRIVYDPK
ncbi:hypothetical protein BLOT_005749 [Blomia tropicalis]|nr:hypothetical protein BLOT_005749 [Blomia tropicalis]